MPQETPLRPPDGFQVEWYEAGRILKKWFRCLEDLTAFAEAIDNLPIQLTINTQTKKGGLTHGIELESR